MKVTNTIYQKGRAESTTEADANGNSYQITTSKNSSGRIECTAIQGKEKQGQGYKTFTYDMFGAKRMKLASKEGRATDKSIQEVHTAGLLKFAEEMEKEKTTAASLYIIEIGQIFFSDGIESKTNRRAVYKIESPGEYRTVTLDGQFMRVDDHVKPYSEKFGIGTYYNEGDKITAAEVEELLIKAREADRQRKQAAETARTAAAIERNQKIAAGIKILPAIPEGVKAVIVAELKENTSDIMTDYHGHTVKKVVYLAWSEHTRDIFTEMRKAAGKFEETAHLKTAPVKPADAPEYWTAPDEHREKYSMGSGYYLSTGHSNASGWSVQKENLPSLETLQIAAAEGRFFCNVEPSQEERPEPVEVPAGTVQIIDYSDKAIAVIGETRPIKDKLKELGGRFNFRLTCGPGWIFKKSDLSKITAALSKPAAVQAPDPEEIPEEPTPEEAAQIEELTEDPTSTEGKTFATYEEAEEAALIKVRARAMAKHTETNPPAPLQEETAKNYDTLEEIEEAANSGEVISLYNLHELVNKKTARVKEIAAKVEPSRAAAAMRATAEKLTTMADEQSAKMQTIRAEIAEEVQKIKEIGTSEDGFFRVSGPTPASIEARRIESDQRKTGRSNTALPAPQMFINF